jgi:hypothetical protein
MYQKKPSSRPSTTNPDGTFSVMVEIRIDRTRGAHAIAAGASLPTPIQRDESFDPVDMDGGTTILRYNVRTQADVETLKRQPGVVAVWTDTPIEPMTPR